MSYGSDLVEPRHRVGELTDEKTESLSHLLQKNTECEKRGRERSRPLTTGNLNDGGLEQSVVVVAGGGPAAPPRQQ
jgi:hypothetical protein